MDNLKLALNLFMLNEEFETYNKTIQTMCIALFYLLKEFPSPDMLRSKNSQEPTK